MKIICSDTGAVYKTDFQGTRFIYKTIGYYPKLTDDSVTLKQDEINAIIKKFPYGITDTRPAAERPATQKQIAYLNILGIDTKGKNLTVKAASKLIEFAKAGEWVGSFGMNFIDGSN